MASPPINCTAVMKPQGKLWTIKLRGVSWVRKTLMCQEADMLRSHRERAQNLQVFPPPTHSPCPRSGLMHCFHLPLPGYSFCNKTIIFTITPSVSFLSPSNKLSNLSGSWGVQMAPDTCGWRLKWAVLFRILPLTCRSALSVSSVRTELNYRTFQLVSEIIL